MRHKREVSLAVATAAFVMMAGSSQALADLDATMCIIDGALHITTDGDAGRQVKIHRGDKKFTKDRFRKSAKEDGFTGSTHIIDPWDPDTWPPGTYEFLGKDADDVKMETTATLDDCEPDEPVIESISGCDVEDFGDPAQPSGCIGPDFLPDGDGDQTVDFEDVNSCAEIDHYSVHFQCEDLPAVTVEVDPADCSLGTCTATIVGSTGDYSGDDLECTVKVTAVDDTCNETSSSLTYMTDDDGVDN